MNTKNVSLCVQYHLCTSCGICLNTCPRGCISYHRDAGLYVPVIDETLCTQCGLCQRICSGLKMSFDSHYDLKDNAIGHVLETYNTYSQDDYLRHISASGGTLMTLVRHLLLHHHYDAAFCVNTYTYDHQVKSERIVAEQFDDSCQKKIPKSRYIPVSHEQAIAYIKEHQDEKVILIGTSCAIRGLKAYINIMRLNQKHYLFLGLFCDSAFNYNVYSYFNQTFGQGKLTALHFKNKDCGGWPGNMKLFLEDGNSLTVDQSERTKMKPYFMLERCLYCIDKLNVEADISFGDNFTKKDSSTLGSNSVIIRTIKGQDTWRLVKDEVISSDVTIDEICEAQYLEGRLNHAYFAKLKCQAIKRIAEIDLTLNDGIILNDDYLEYRKAWELRVKDLQAGSLYHKDPKRLDQQIRRNKKRKNSKSLTSIYERVYYGIRRRMKR